MALRKLIHAVRDGMAAVRKRMSGLREAEGRRPGTSCKPFATPCEGWNTVSGLKT
jgi:hypothetical protein